MLAGAVVGFGISTYETAVNGVDWAKDEAHWLAGAANDTYCWLKHGVYEQCDDVILNMLLGVTFPNVVVVSLIVTRVIGLFGFR
jgi:hypothetical protein